MTHDQHPPHISPNYLCYQDPEATSLKPRTHHPRYQDPEMISRSGAPRVIRSRYHHRYPPHINPPLIPPHPTHDVNNTQRQLARNRTRHTRHTLNLIHTNPTATTAKPTSRPLDGRHVHSKPQPSVRLRLRLRARRWPPRSFSPFARKRQSLDKPAARSDGQVCLNSLASAVPGGLHRSSPPPTCGTPSLGLRECLSSPLARPTITSHHKHGLAWPTWNRISEFC